jgi:hypothetical protein
MSDHLGIMARPNRRASQARGRLSIGRPAETRRNRNVGLSWLSRRLPRWHVSWTRTVLSPAGGLAVAGSGNPDRPRKGGSSLVIIISAR